MRLFTAIELPEHVRNRLAAVQDSLKAIDAPLSWTAPSKLHLTLNFLREVNDEASRLLRRSLRNIAVPNMSLLIPKLSVLPQRGPTRVVTADVELSPALHKLQTTIAFECLRLGLDLELRLFRPHISLARLRSPQRVAREIASVAFEPISFEVREFVLMQSILSGSGSSYCCLARFGPV